MRTELLIFTRPQASGLNVADTTNPNTASQRSAPNTNTGQSIGGIGHNIQQTKSSILDRINQPIVNINDIGAKEAYNESGNINKTITPAGHLNAAVNGGVQGLKIDLYDDIAIPITYTILDIREPDKRKTSWSKSIIIPGTKSNNRIFNHIYEISKDGWVTIGKYQVFQGFNPNIRKEVILMQDGIQIFKGNLQLKRVTRKVDGNIEYEVILNGDLTSLFFDVGNSKLSDLNFLEWNHNWSKTNIINSWSGNLIKNNQPYSNTTLTTVGGWAKTIVRQLSTGRTQYKMNTAHGLVQGDYINISTSATVSTFKNVIGSWMVSDIISSTEFTINQMYPMALQANGETISASTLIIKKEEMSGKGYVYPMVSWGDEYDIDSFPVTALIPGVYFKEIWDKIMKTTNSTYVSSFLDSQMFKRLVLIQKKDRYDVNPAEISERTFRVGMATKPDYEILNANFSGIGERWINSMQPHEDTVAHKIAPSTPYVPNNYENSEVYFTNSTVTGGGTKWRMPLNIESGGSGTGSYCDGNCDGFTSSVSNWDKTTYSWKVVNSGEYQASAALKVSVWAQMNGYVGPAGSSGWNNGNANGTASFSPSSKDYAPGVRGSNGNPNSSIGQTDPRTINTTPKHGFGTQDVGVYIGIVIKRKRGTAITTIADNGYSFIMDPAHKYSSVLHPAPQLGWKNFGKYQPNSWENRQMQCDYYGYFAAGDEVWCETYYYLQAITKATPSNFATLGRKVSVAFYQWDGAAYSAGQDPIKNIYGDFFLQVEQPCVMWNVPSSKSSENSELMGNKIVPKDMTCKDFLNSVIKMFNLHIEPDQQVERKYYIEPRDDYYYTGANGATDYVDWSTKIDETSIDIIPMSELSAKYYTFENKPESDYWNSKFKVDRGRDYMSYTKEIENDFLKNEQKISVNFGSTVMINNPDGSDVVMPAVLQREDSGSFKPQSNSAARCLIWGGLRPYASAFGSGTLGNGWELLSSTEVAGSNSATSSKFTYYPYAGTVDSPNDPHYDINWFNMQQGDFVYWDKARWSDHNLFNAYWKNMLVEISDPASLVLQAMFRLEASDIAKIDFRKIYVIGNNYMRLQKIIDYEPINGGLTKVELLKVKKPSKYTRSSVWQQEPMETINHLNGGLIRTEIHYPPIRRNIIGGGYGNQIPLQSQTITVSGKANIVGNSKNIKINGDENHVSHDCSNIHISNGDSNFISGGITNVTIIGTHNKVITESDVTYINDVRYKNGVPISRANIINGGQNIVLPTNGTNTVINVINGGEDIANTDGSNTYENVIDAGQNSILPDLAELGLSTNTTPHPKTNYMGGAGYIGSPTQSTVELVRTNRARYNN